MGRRVRVATYNLYLGADLGLLLGHRPPAELAAHRAEVQRQLAVTAFPRRAATVARLLARERLDLVALQEVCTWSAGEVPMWDYTRLLLAELEALGEPYDVVVSQPTFHGTGDLQVEEETVSLRLEGSNTILRRRGSRVRVESTRAGLFGSALRLPLEAVAVTIERGWCQAGCTVDGPDDTTFTFVDTHTEAYEAGSRERQRDELLARLAGEAGRLVVAGDFNAGPEDVGMPRDLRDAWTAAGHPSQGTSAATCGQAADLGNRESRLTERIDYVWVRGLDVVSSHRIGAEPGDKTPEGRWPSDHAGVVAELELV